MNDVNVKPVGEELARELSQTEIEQIGGAASTGSCTGKVTSGSDWEASCTVDW